MIQAEYTYEPLVLTRMLLGVYVDNHVADKVHKLVRHNYYEFLRTMTDDELEGFLGDFVKRQGITEITFADFEGDFKVICEIIEQSERFQTSLRERQIANLTTYKYEVDKGISGILFASGEFIQCGYQEHSIIAGNFSWEEQNKAVYFSSPLRWESSTVSFSPLNKNREMSRQQVSWIKQHEAFMDTMQRTLLGRTIYVKVT